MFVGRHWPYILQVLGTVPNVPNGRHWPYILQVLGIVPNVPNGRHWPYILQVLGTVPNVPNGRHWPYILQVLGTVPNVPNGRHWPYILHFFQIRTRVVHSNAAHLVICGGCHCTRMWKNKLYNSIISVWGRFRSINLV